MKKKPASRFRTTHRALRLLLAGSFIFTIVPALAQGPSDSSADFGGTPITLTDNTHYNFTPLVRDGVISTDKKYEFLFEEHLPGSSAGIRNPRYVYFEGNLTTGGNRSTIREYTLLELVLSHKKDFTLHKDIYDESLTRQLIDDLHTALANTGYRPEVFGRQKKEAFSFTNKTPAGTATALREGRFRKQELIPRLADRNVRQLLVLDTCRLTVDLESGYTGKKSERRMTGAVVLTIDTEWHIYSGDGLNECRPVRHSESVRAGWKNTYLRNRIPEIQDLLLKLRFKTTQAVLDAL